MEKLLNQIASAAGWSILHTLWQSALLYAVFIPFLNSKSLLSAPNRYRMAYAANCLIFISFLITFYKMFSLPVKTGSWPSYQQAQDPFTGGLQLQISGYIQKASPAIALLYLLGLMLKTFLVIKGYKRVRELRKLHLSAVPGAWQTLLEKLLRETGIEKAIRIHLSGTVSVPLVIGHLKPVILFPVALVNHLDLQQVEAILIHELSHIKRNDYLMNLISTAIDTLLFFNPFVQLFSKQLDIEREHACDDMVVSRTAAPLTYAQALLKIELSAARHPPAFALAATGETQHLYQRIKRITDMKTNYRNAKQKLFAVTLALATIVSLAWINPSKSGLAAQHPKISKAVSSWTISQLSPADTGKKKLSTGKVYRYSRNVSGHTLPAQPPLPPKSPQAPPAPPVFSTPVPAAPLAGPNGPEAPAVPPLPGPEAIKIIADLSMQIRDMVILPEYAADTEQVRRMEWEGEKLRQALHADLQKETQFHESVALEQNKLKKAQSLVRIRMKNMELALNKAKAIQRMQIRVNASVRPVVIIWDKGETSSSDKMPD